jgi:GAF domain-containing protein
MLTNLVREKEKSKEELLKELKVLRAQLAVVEESKLAQRKAELETDLLKRIILKVIEANDFHEALGIALLEVCESTGWLLGHAWIPNKNKLYLDCSSAWYSKVNGLESFRAFSQEYKMPLGVGLPGRVWESKKPHWIRDISIDPSFPRAQVAKECELKACFGVPILTQDGEVIAIIEFFMQEIKEEDARLVEVISTIAAQLGIVFERKQMETALSENEKRLKELNESLEKRVQERTKELLRLNKELESQIEERIQSEKELKANEEKYKKLIETANDAILIVDAETNLITHANKQAEILLGMPLDKIIGIPQVNIHPKDEI